MLITSDHGSIQPDHLPAPDENNYRIPMIISGGIAEGKRLLVHEVVSQLDVAFSLSEWCALGTSFEYNSDLLSPRDIAFYNYFNGLALIRGSCVQWYDLPQSKYLKGPCTESLEKTLFSKAQEDFFNPD